MTDTGKIEKIDATAEEILEAIFRAADGDDFQKSAESGEEDSGVDHNSQSSPGHPSENRRSGCGLQ